MHRRTELLPIAHDPLGAVESIDPSLADPNEPDDDLSDIELTDDELAALALAADPDQPLAPDAVALELHPGSAPSLLPLWYMPPVMARRGRWWRAPVVYAVIAAFLLINGLGLCITYGQLVGA
jgi:hypothetical protein